MKLFLSTILVLFGITVVCIASAMIFVGPQATGNFFSKLLSEFFNIPSKMGGLENANADSELRFYSAFFLSYGIILVMVGKKLERYFSWIPILAAVFLLAGSQDFSL